MAVEKKKLVFNPLTGAFDVSLDVSGMADTADVVATYIPLSQKGVANGVVPLDAGNKISAAFLPNSVMELQGYWDASTNTPTLVDGTGNPGDVWEVEVAGTVNFGSGSIIFKVGDWAVYAADAKWHRSINSNEVVSVNGLTGAVTLDTDDVSEGSTNLYYTSARFNTAFAAKSTDGLTEGVTNLYYTNARAKAAAVADVITDGVTDVAPSQNAVFHALALKAPLASPALTGTPTAPTAAPATNTTQVATTEFVTTAVASVTGADTALSNLVTTSINQSLLPDVDVIRGLGSAAKRWTTLHVQKIQNQASNLLSITNGTLVDFATEAPIASWISNKFTIVVNKILSFGLTTGEIQISANPASSAQAYVLPTAAPTVNGYSLTATTAGVMSWASARAVAPTQQIFTSGSGTYNRPANCVRIRVRVVASGGGGAAGGTANVAGGNAANTTFGAATCNGGVGAPNYVGGSGGTLGSLGGYLGWIIKGGDGSSAIATSASAPYATGGHGGCSFFGGGGYGGVIGNGNTSSAPGSGGGGGTGNNAVSRNGGGGGQAGDYAEFTITNPAATYSYSIGAAGTGPVSGALGGGNGAPGAPGIIIVDEEY